MQEYFGDLAFVRVLLQRGIAAIYFVAFLSALNQFRPLLGERGLLPVPEFLSRRSFWNAPSVYHFKYSDRFFAGTAWAGLALSVAALTGLSESGPFWLSIVVWLTLYALYLSIVNVGQTFYSFGWESMLLEAGFFAAFLGSSDLAPSLIPVLALRWMLFRVELGAGLIKLRHDPCWRNLTCLYYHHETQPMPNPLSAHFHRLPKPVHRTSVAFSHFVQVLVPFGLFAPQPIASMAGCLIILHQLLLVVSGNYAWLNWLTIVLGFSAFSDQTLATALPIAPETLAARPQIFDVLLYTLALATVLLSIKPTLNLFSKHQSMNASYNPLHLVGSYGAFGSVTRQRHEVILEGTDDVEPTSSSAWREYHFKGKPGDPRRAGKQWAPYHLRLDWLLWFVPLQMGAIRGRVMYDVWFMRLVEKLLQSDPAIRKLLGRDPFGEHPPKWIRARMYHYRFATRAERQQTGDVWMRAPIGEYLPAVGRRPEAADASDREPGTIGLVPAHSFL